MNIQGIRNSITAIKKNISRLRKKAETSAKAKAQLEKFERKLQSRIDMLTAAGLEVAAREKPHGKKPKFNFKSYAQYICSPAWAKRRSDYFKGHDKKCRTCGDDKGLHLHHRTYVRLGSESDNDLMPLCRKCHAVLHLYQKTFGLAVEEATEHWVASTNATKKKKKVRECLRKTPYHKIKNLWSRHDKSNPVYANVLSSFVESLIGEPLGVRTDIKIEEALQKKIAFANRTGNVSDYDKSVDTLIRRLEGSLRRNS